ncbi:hypothetical protein KI387_022318, partial [Taxus chinensis]
PECSLDFNAYPYSASSSCLVADNFTYVDWRGVSGYPCCVDAYVAFGKALALKVNQSGGPIFLEKEEIVACSQPFTQAHPELQRCYFNELDRTQTGFCYNTTIDDIRNTLGKQLNSLQTICNGTLVVERSNMGKSEACRDCYAMFINATQILNSLLGGGRNALTDIPDCEMALLIAMDASRIRDSQWVDSLSTCLVYAQMNNHTFEAVGAVIGLIAIFLLVIVLVSHLKKIPKTKEGKGNIKLNGEHGSRLVKFSSEEILNAMNYTSPWAFLGEGSTGKVYKGKLPSGQYIAIKHICKDFPKPEAFLMEITTLSKIRHNNLVSLLGFCDENDEQYFVYEYCANGNLSQMLLGLKDKVLTWEQRVKIAYDSPTNILLTESMEAKLADFGLLRMFKIQETKVYTDVKGTMGYLDPEYASQGRLTCSSDIYSFGIVLLQLLSGRRAIDFDQSHRESLLRKAHRVSQANPIDPSKFADPRLNGEYSREAFEILLKLAVLCTAPSCQGRPRVSEAYEEIYKAWTISTGIHL